MHQLRYLSLEVTGRAFEKRRRAGRGWRAVASGEKIRPDGRRTVGLLQAVQTTSVAWGTAVLAKRATSTVVDTALAVVLAIDHETTAVPMGVHADRWQMVALVAAYAGQVPIGVQDLRGSQSTMMISGSVTVTWVLQQSQTS